MKNTAKVTITIPGDLLKKAKELAARDGKSLSCLVQDAIADMVSGSAGYAEARRR